MFDRKFIFHIISEVIVILSVVLFFFNEKRRLENKINDLESKLSNISSHVISLETQMKNMYIVQQQYIFQHKQPISLQTNYSNTEVENISKSMEEYQNVPFDDILSPKQIEVEKTEDENIDFEIMEELAELDENK